MRRPPTRLHPVEDVEKDENHGEAGKADRDRGDVVHHQASSATRILRTVSGNSSIRSRS